MKLIRVKTKDANPDFYYSLIKNNLPDMKDRISKIEKIIANKDNMDLDTLDKLAYTLSSTAETISKSATELKKMK